MPLRREIRTLQLRQRRYIEDRLWPTFAALVLLAGVLATIVVRHNRFDDPRVEQNSAVQLMAIVVTLVVSLWAVRRAGSPRTRRYQLSLVLSLAAHVLLAVFLGYQHLLLQRERIQQVEIDQVNRPIEEEVLPEIVVSVPTADDERQEIENPLASTSPQLQTDQFTRQRSTPKYTDAPQQAQELPEAEPQLVPHTERLLRPQESIANRASTPSLRSRRESNEPAKATSTVIESTPAALAQPERPVPRQLSAAVAAPLSRADLSAPQVSELLPSTEAPDSEQAQVALVEPRREQPNAPTTIVQREAVPDRSAPAPAALAASPIGTDAPVANGQQTSLPPQPNRPQLAPLDRSQAAAPLLARNVPRALPDTVSPAANHPQPRQLLLEELPTIAKDTEPSRQRRRVDMASNTAAEAATDQLSEMTALRSRQVFEAQPTTPTLARTAPVEQPASATDRAVRVAMNSPRPQMSERQTRVSSDSQPSIRTEGGGRQPSERSFAAAQLAAAGSMEMIEVPTSRTSDGGGGSSAPSSTAPPADIARAAQSLSDASVAAPTRSLAGSPETTIAGRLSLTPIPRRRSAENLSGAQPGGGERQPLRSRVPVTAAPAMAQVAALEAAPPAGITTSARPSPTAVGVESPAQHDAVRSTAVPPGAQLALPSAPVIREASATGAASTASRSATLSNAPTLSQIAMVPRNRDQLAASLPGTTIAVSEPALSVTSAEGTDNQINEAIGHSARHSAEALHRSPGRPPVLVDASSGLGGLSAAPAPTAGLPHKRAQREATLVHMTPARVLKKRVGGTPSINGAARVPAAAFAQRGRRQEKLLSGGDGKPSAKTEAAIELGLNFLSRLQLPNGRWGFDQLNDDTEFTAGKPASLRADAAATGLALLAFLGAGYDHFDDQYQDLVRKGLEYLVHIQKPSGELFPEGAQTQSTVARFYSHGIAALALCEAFGMTGDPQLHQPAQQALNYIVQTQHARFGGWRYVPGLNTDLSVTGWQLMALRSGELASLEVPQATYDRIRTLLEACREEGPDGARFRYNPWASASNPRTRHGRNPSTVMTAVGLLAELYLGSNRDDQLMQLGANHLVLHLPESGPDAWPALTGTLDNPMRDTYYWYYATQVMFHMRGHYWQQWNDRLHPLLVDTQVAKGALAGSWSPHEPVSDKWASYGGRLYVTTMNLLSLEVYYRHLPLYEMTAQ